MCSRITILCEQPDLLKAGFEKCYARSSRVPRKGTGTELSYVKCLEKKTNKGSEIYTLALKDVNECECGTEGKEGIFIQG